MSTFFRCILRVVLTSIVSTPVAQGRLLVKKEQDALIKGYPIGEVLHSAYFDLEFPTVAKAGKGERVCMGWWLACWLRGSSGLCRVCMKLVRHSVSCAYGGPLQVRYCKDT